MTVGVTQPSQICFELILEEVADIVDFGVGVAGEQIDHRLTPTPAKAH